MASEFHLDISELRRAIESAPEIVGKGTEEAMDAIKDDWVLEARNIAPMKSSNLRKQIKGQVRDAGLDSSIVVTGNSINRTGGAGRFNYGYYIHELDAGGNEMQTPGTEKKFLEKSVDERKWQRYLVNKVLSKLRRMGWDG